MSSTARIFSQDSAPLGISAFFPTPETVAEIRKSGWRDALEKCRLLTSPSYHLLRDWHRLPPLPYLGRRLAYIADDPNLDCV